MSFSNVADRKLTDASYLGTWSDVGAGRAAGGGGHGGAPRTTGRAARPARPPAWRSWATSAAAVDTIRPHSRPH